MSNDDNIDQEIVERKPEINVNSSQKSKPLNEWKRDEVQNWFCSYEGGLFKDYANSFTLYDGKALLKLTEQQCKEILKDVSMGILLFNTIQDLEKGNYFHKNTEGKLKNVTLTKVFFYL